MERPGRSDDQPGLFARAKARMSAFEDRNNERRVLRGRCAVTDKAFDAEFVRRKGETVFTFDRAITGGAEPAKGAVPSLEKTEFDIDEFALRSMNCPHCDSAKFIRCGGCDAFVCDGRSGVRDNAFYFRCARSCGNSGPTGTLTKVEAYKPASPLALTKQSPLLRIRDQR